MALVTIKHVPVQIGGRLMVRRFVILVGTDNMATGTVTAMRHYADVIPARRKPTVGAVAMIAGVGRPDSGVVVGWSASGNPAVMAINTLPRSCRAVIEARIEEGKSVEVAALTGHISHDVTGGFRCRHHSSIQRMTAVASLGRTFEHAGDMAILAGRCGMPSVKREAGSLVIEHLLWRLGCGHCMQ